MKDFIKKLFGKSEENAEQSKTEAPAEETSSVNEQSEDKTM